MSFDNCLPPGWEAKFDNNLGKTYYINHYEKTTSWDPPFKNKRSTASTSMTYSKQTNGTSKHLTNMGTEFIPLQDMSIKSRGSPLSVRPKVQDSSLTVLTDTDEAVSKINATFPTVSEAHIRLLMKNCRYMKSIFPQAEETIILDILSNNDNSIQKSSEKLREMGFEKKDSLKISQQKAQSKIMADEAENFSVKATVVIPRIKSSEEKAKAKLELQNQHRDIPERLITIALESVDFDKDKASNLLRSSSQDAAKIVEGRIVAITEIENETAHKNKDIMLPPSQSRQSLKSLLKSDKTDKEKSIFNRVLEETNSGHRSSYLSNTRGANPELTKGNDEKLLLEDYVRWHGPNSSLQKGSQQGLAKGPNVTNLLERHLRAFGPNAEFHKGPNRGSMKGSIFQQMKAVTIGGESRGK